MFLVPPLVPPILNLSMLEKGMWLFHPSIASNFRNASHVDDVTARRWPVSALQASLPSHTHGCVSPLTIQGQCDHCGDTAQPCHPARLPSPSFYWHSCHHWTDPFLFHWTTDTIFQGHCITPVCVCAQSSAPLPAWTWLCFSYIDTASAYSPVFFSSSALTMLLYMPSSTFMWVDILFKIKCFMIISQRRPYSLPFLYLCVYF